MLVLASVIVLLLLLLVIHIETVDKSCSMLDELKLLERCLLESDRCKKNANRVWIWIICWVLFFFLPFQSNFLSIIAFHLQLIYNITMSRTGLLMDI